MRNKNMREYGFSPKCIFPYRDRYLPLQWKIRFIKKLYSRIIYVVGNKMYVIMATFLIYFVYLTGNYDSQCFFQKLIVTSQYHCYLRTITIFKEFAKQTSLASILGIVYYEKYTTKNTVISPNFLVWKLWYFLQCALVTSQLGIIVG